MTDRIYDFSLEAGWLAFAQELRARLGDAEEAPASSDFIEILDAAACRRSVPAPLQGEPAGNVLAFPGRPEPKI